MLISAPAGFRKTTLASEWGSNPRLGAAGEGRVKDRTAWLSLDDADNDPARFLTYVIAALNRAEGQETPIGMSALSMLQSPQPTPTEAVLTSLINDVATVPNRTILILDDYQLIEARCVQKAVTFLLEHLPPQMHLAIATREDPDLPLSWIA